MNAEQRDTTAHFGHGRNLERRPGTGRPGLPRLPFARLAGLAALLVLAAVAALGFDSGPAALSAPGAGDANAPAAVPAISATLTDALVNDADSDTKADPGDTIGYTVVINNSGTDATGVAFNATLDANTTLVGGSLKAGPLAIADTAYKAAGNTPLSVDAASGLLANDYDVDGVTPPGSLVATAETKATSAGGSVTINADGSFTYTPQTGDQNLADTFTYTVKDGDNLPSTGTASIDLGDAVWYLDSTYAGANGPEDGSSSRPFNAFGDVTGVTGPDLAGDIFFVKEVAGDYTGTFALLANQQVFGSGVTLVVNTVTINTAGPNTTASATDANSITLNSGNTVRGFTFGANGTGTSIAGSSVGALTIANVTKNGTGAVLDLTSTTSDLVSVTIDNATSTSSTTAVSLTNLHGTVTVSAGALSGATAAEVSVSGGDANVTYSGTMNGTAGRLVSVQNTTGGTVLFDSTATPALVDSGTGILIDGAAGNVTVNNADLNGSLGIEILGDAGNNATGTFTFTNVTIDTTAGATNHAFKVDGDQGVAGNNDVSATIDLNNVDITNPGGNVASIQGMNGGSVDFDAASAITRNNGGLGFSAVSNAGGTITVNSTQKTLNTGANVAVDLQNNTGATIAFPGGGLQLTTTTGTGLNATGGGTVTVGTGTNPNTISSGAATALNIANTGIGAGDVTFQSISANGGSNPGISLDTTGTSGKLVITGATPGGACTLATPTCTGGQIQNKTTNGIRLNSTSNASFTRIYVHNNGGNGIYGTNLNGFVLDTSVLVANGDAPGEAGLRLGDPADNNLNGVVGSATNGANPTKLLSVQVSASGEHNVAVFNSSGTLTDLFVDQMVSQNTNTTVNGADGFTLETRSTAVATVHVQGSTFTNNATQGIQGQAVGTSTLKFYVATSTFTSNGEGVVLDHFAGSDLVAQVQSSTFTGHDGAAIVVSDGSNVTSAGSLNAQINNNIVTVPATAVNHGIIGFMSGNGNTSRIQVNDNTVTNNGSFDSIRVDTPDAGSTVTFSALLIHNTVTNGATATDGVVGQARQNSNGCFKIETNTGTVQAGFSVARIRQVNPVSGTSTATLERGVSGSNVAATVIADNNTSPTSAVGTVTVVNNNTCATPNLASALPASGANYASAAPVDATPTAAATVLDAPAVLPAGVVESIGYRTDRDVTANVPAAAPAPNAAGETVTVTFPNGGLLPANGNVTIVFRATVNGTATNPPPAFSVSVQGHVTATGGTDVLTDDPDTGAASDPTVTDLDVNHAPVLADTNVTMSVPEDGFVPSPGMGTLVSDLVDLSPPVGGQDNVTDADPSPVTGMAITAVDQTHGLWFYSTDGGAGWSRVSSNFSPVADDSAELLAADANILLFFEPSADFNGTVAGALTFRAWDRNNGLASGTKADTTANGTTTSYSTATDTISVTVTEVNDAPIVVDDTLSAVDEDSPPRDIPFSDLLGNDSAGPANESGQTLTVALLSAPFVGGTAALDSINNKVVFTLTPDFNGTASFFYVAKDDGTTNGAADAKTNVGHVTFTVNPAAEQPGANPSPASTNEDTQTGDIIITPNAADGPEVTHFKFTNITGGALYKHDGTTQINDGDFITVAEGADGVRFTPNPDLNTPAGDAFSFDVQGGTDNLGGGLGPATNVPVTVAEVNDAPVADDDPLSSVAEDSGPRDIPLADLLNGDVPGPINEIGQTLTVTGVSNFVGGTAVLDTPNSKVVFTPAANFNGTASFDYTVEDNGTTAGSPDPKTDVGAVSFDVTPTAEAPAISPVTTAEDTPSGAITITPDAADGGAVTHFKITNITGGTLYQNDGLTPINDGDFITAAQGAAGLKFNPSLDANTPAGDTFSFTAQAAFDAAGTGIGPGANASITVTEVNDPPTAISDALAPIAEDSGARTIPFADLTGNDSAGPANEGTQALTVLGVGNATGGTVAIQGTDVIFTPAADFNGAASFDYTIQDDGTTNGAADPLVASASVTFSVTEVNDTPTRTAGTVADLTVAEDSGLTSLGLDGGTPVDYSPGPGEGGQSLTYTVTAVPSPALGDVVLADGTTVVTTATTYTLAQVRGMQFRTAADANGGPETFTFTVTDDGTTNGAPDPKTLTESLTITVTAVNDAPSATDDPLTSVAEDSGNRTIHFADLTGNDSTGPANESAQTLTVTFVGNATGGTVAIQGTDVVFSPDQDFNGAASFDYTVQDNGQTNGVDDFKTDTGTVTFTVTEVNDPPIATDDNLSSIAEDSGVRSIPFVDLLTNDSPGPGNEGTQTRTVSAVSNPVNGTVQINGANVEFTPDANFFGTASFDYTLQDDGTTNGVNDFLTDTGHVTFDVTAVAEAPVLNPNPATTAEDLQTADILITPGAPDGTEVTHFKITAITNGTLYKHDGTTQINDGDFITLAEGADGVRFTPDANQHDPTPFGFSVQGATGTTGGGTGLGTATVETILVGDVNDPPVAGDDPLSSVAEDSGDRTVAITDLLANDTPGPADESAQALNIIGVGNETGGTAEIVGTDVVFHLAANFNGTASFDYTVQDDGTPGGDPAAATGHVSFTVTEINDAPTANDDTLGSVDEDSGQRNIGAAVLTGNDSAGPNESAQALTVTAAANATGGTVLLNGTTVEFTPYADFHGTAGFDYTVQDNGTTNGAPDAKSDDGHVSFTVNAVADTPSVTDATTNEDTQTSSGLVVTLNAVDGAEVTHFKVTNITGGSLFKNDGTTAINNGDFITAADGAAGLRFTPAANANDGQGGPFGFDVQASVGATNAGLGGAAVHATIQVTPVNDAPSLVQPIPDKTALVHRRFTVFLDGVNTAPFIDADGDPLTFTATKADGSPLPAWLTYDAANTALSGVPEFADVGTFSVKVTAKDPSNLAATDTFSITVEARHVIVTPTSGLTTTEAGGTATFTVKLDAAPGANVTIPLSSSDTTEGTVSPSSLVFTSANWNTPQTVTVTGVDDATVDGDVAYQAILGTSDSIDGTFDGIDVPDVSVTNRDDDAQVSFTAATGTGPETTATVPIEVKLTGAPQGPVTVVVKATGGLADGGMDYTLSVPGSGSPNVPAGGGTLTFAPGETSKTVTLTVIRDQVFERDETVELTLSDPNGATLGAVQRFTYTITDVSSGRACQGKPETKSTTNGRIIAGTPGNDVIIGTTGDDIIYGNGGTDIICGLGGDDLIRAGNGSDSLNGGEGDDILLGYGGKDTLRGGPGKDRLYGGIDDDRLVGQGGDDTLLGAAGNDTLLGGAGNDTLNGQAGNDTLSGGAGKDDLTGGPGKDVLHGDAGDDTVRGSAGADQSLGDDGNDKLSGGPGAPDTCDGGPGTDALIPGAGCENVVNVP